MFRSTAETPRSPVQPPLVTCYVTSGRVRPRGLQQRSRSCSSGATASARKVARAATTTTHDGLARDRPFVVPLGTPVLSSAFVGQAVCRCRSNVNQHQEG